MTEADRSLTQKTAAGVAWISGFQGAKQLLQVISVSVLARRIPAATYGLLGMAILVTNLLETIRDLGTGTALVRERAMPEELVSTAFWLDCATGAAVTLLVILVSWPAARFFHEPRVATILRFLAISFFLGAISVVPTALLHRALEFRKLAFAQTTGAICGAVVAIVVALCGGKVSSLVSANLTISLTTTAAIWFFSPLRVKAVFRVADARRILSFGLHLTGFNVLQYFSRNADNVLVGRFLGSGPLGYYQMGYMLMTYPLQSFNLMLYQVVYPALSNLPDDQERFRAAYLRSCRLIALVTFPLMIGLAVTAQPFIRLFLGARWMPVAGLLLVFGPLGAAESIYTTVGLIYNTQGRPDLRLRWTVFASTLYVLSFVVGLRWGILGVASSYAIVWTALMFPSFAIPFRLVGLSIKTFVQALWPMMWYSLVMAVAAGGWLHGLHRLGIENAAVEFTTTAAVGAVLYTALVLWRSPPVLSELSAVLEGSSHRGIRYAAGYLSRATRRTQVLGSGEATSSPEV